MKTATTQPLEFARGRRKRKDVGVTYPSRCGRYEIYKSDQLYGVAITPVRWLAIRLGEHGRVISRHWKRAAAERACECDANPKRKARHAKRRTRSAR